MFVYNRIGLGRSDPLVAQCAENRLFLIKAYLYMVYSAYKRNVLHKPAIPKSPSQ